MKVWVDANPHQICFVTETGAVLIEDLIGSHTNNEAEYQAVILALHIEGVIEILSDSELVVKQLNHNYHIKKESLRVLAMTAWNLARGRDITFTWIPREENKAGKVLG